MIYASAKFAVAMSKILGGDAFTRNITAARTNILYIRMHAHQAADRLWYEINIPFFSKEKSRYNNSNDFGCEWQ